MHTQTLSAQTLTWRERQQQERDSGAHRTEAKDALHQQHLRRMNRGAAGTP
jgi:hypothetical protein